MISGLRIGNGRGFTLVEMLIAVAVSGLVMIGVWQAYRAQNWTATTQGAVTDMQQNLRVALFQLARDIRMAGYDPRRSGNFGLTSVGFRDLDDDLDVGGTSAITLTADLNRDGDIDAGETISFSICDAPITAGGDGFLDLGRNTGGGRQLLAENIVSMGLAYAFDADDNGALDTTAAGVIWAIDSNNDGLLDRNLDTNADGAIDRSDNPSGGVNLNQNIVGTALGTPVPMNDIRAVRIWLLARARHPDENFHDPNTYVLGRVVTTPADNFRRRLLETVVQCKNMGLN